MKTKVILLILCVLALWGSQEITSLVLQPHVVTGAALDAARGGSVEFTSARLAMELFQTLPFFIVVFALILMLSIVRRGLKSRRLSRRSALTSLVALGLFSLSSCKPYDKAEYLQVQNNETAFVIPLEDAREKQEVQVHLNSEEFLNQSKVMTKRIMVPHRWQANGRLWFQGSWIPMVAVLKVDRSPVTREWNSAGGNRKGSDQAIWIESSDSVGFSMGVSCTAFIKEEDSAKFLHMYPSGSLHTVMDSEIRARVQKVAADTAAMYPLDQLREKKSDIMKALNDDLVPFFALRGISITTIGMFGGMTYENPKIQQSIDEVFVAQQKKNVALAEFEAQAKTNERVLLAAKADAEQITMKATADAQRRMLEAEAESKAIHLVNESLANSSPIFIQLRTLDTQQKQYERWDGRFPTYFMGGISNPNMLLNLPVPEKHN